MSVDIGILLIRVLFGVAIAAHGSQSLFASVNGIELPFLYAAAALGIAFSGPGAFWLDAFLGLAFLSGTYVIGGTLALALIASAVTLALRRQPQRLTSVA